jgi:hypothetical protein
LSYEIELIALAAFFYLYDSSVLLYSNEAVLSCDPAKRWHVTMGDSGLVLAGRSLCILNPLTPFRPSFRLNWSFHAEEAVMTDRSWSLRAEEFAAIAPFTLTAGIALYGLLPLGMFTSLGSYAVIPALLVLYGSILLGLVQLRRKKSLAILGRKRFWGIVFDCLACPPFGVNMVRHVTLADRITEPLPRGAVRLLADAQWHRLRERCESRIDNAISLAAEGSTERAGLEAQKKRLSELEREI